MKLQEEETILPQDLYCLELQLYNTPFILELEYM